MLPKGWQTASVTSVCTQVSVGIVVNPSHYYVADGQGVRAFRSGNVRENAVQDDKWVYLSDDGHQKNSKSKLKAGDVLVVRTGFAGTACVVPKELDGCNCIDILFARPDTNKVVPEYLAQLTNSQLGRKQVLSGQSGLAQKHLNVSTYSKMMFALPPVREQKRIVEVLSTWDRAILSAERLLSNSKRSTRDLMVSLLGGHRRFPGYSDKWRYVDLDSIFERVTRKNTTHNTTVLTISGEHGLISQRDYFSKSVASANLSGYTLLHRHDFAYNKSYSAGYPMGAIKPLLAYEAGVVSSLYLCFRLREDVDADFDFFRHYFEAGLLNQEIEGIAQEGARNHGLLNVSVTDFFKLQLHIPSAPEQRRIAEVINAARAEEALLEAQVRALRQEKAALMSQLLTGKRRVKLSEVESEARV